VPLFETLKVPVFPLHSQLQQKQRLKNLDRSVPVRTISEWAKVLI
jgi:hypothetical protein